MGAGGEGESQAVTKIHEKNLVLARHFLPFHFFLYPYPNYDSSNRNSYPHTGSGQ
jgi:hypothetical protein